METLTPPLLDRDVRTAAEFAAANPVLAVGKLGVTSDTAVAKLGDGVTAWNLLRSFRMAEEPVSAETSVMQTGITAVTDITGLTVTFTVGAVPWMVEGFLSYVSATGVANGSFNITDAAGTIKAATAVYFPIAGSSTFGLVRERIVTPGTYTRKLRIARTGGTGTITVLFDSSVFMGTIKAAPEK